MVWFEIVNPHPIRPGFTWSRLGRMNLDCEVCRDCDCVVGPVLKASDDKYGTEVERVCWEIVYCNDTDDDLLCEDCYVGLLYRVPFS